MAYHKGVLMPYETYMKLMKLSNLLSLKNEKRVTMAETVQWLIDNCQDKIEALKREVI